MARNHRSQIGRDCDYNDDDEVNHGSLKSSTKFLKKFTKKRQQTPVNVRKDEEIQFKAISLIVKLSARNYTGSNSS